METPISPNSGAVNRLHDHSPCCAGGSCGDVSRRAFIQLAGIGATSLVAPSASGGAAVDDEAASVAVRHFVPAEKNLDPHWLQSLRARGAPRVFRGRELNYIGMPCGGIAAGQLYLRGDGTLGCWRIFRETYATGYGQTNYQPAMPERLVDQGFALLRFDADGAVRETQELNRHAFPDVEFRGEYPIAVVTYARADFPLRIQMEAFSPFIPLLARDSALPATIFNITIENRGSQDESVALLGWLENAICFHSARDFKLDGCRRTERFEHAQRAYVVHSAESLAPASAAARPDIVIADFETESYGDWHAEGTAVGNGPTRTPFKNQQPVTGFQGAGYVNTFQGNDNHRGTLTSPKLLIERNYIHFLIGGGDASLDTCVQLIIDEKLIYSTAGARREQLAWHCWDVREYAGKTAIIKIVDEREGPWGHINVDQIIQTDRVRYGKSERIEELEDAGTMCLALGGAPASQTELGEWTARLSGRASEWRLATNASYSFDARIASALATQRVSLRPGESRSVQFALSWHFPNRSNGQMYVNAYASAGAVANDVLDRHEQLCAQTRAWRDTWYDSTLPYWLLDRLFAPVANLATGTCLWWKNGRFWAWEGVGCCEGTCTHVWNYAHALARLFPELERSARTMQDLESAFHPDGLIGTRGLRDKFYAADGQAGTVLKCYREHLMSATDAFMRTNWPRIKLTLEFLLRHDPNEDGLIEDTQHNTFDINFEGANTFVGSLYLAALRAGAQLAEHMNDAEFAARCRRIAEAGARASVERLWNGEYFVQQVDLAKFPRDQYADGCLSDQVFGQGWAHQLGLGYVYPRANVQAALRSVWKYNWAPDIGPHNGELKPERWFATPGEAGLFVCTFPRSKYLDRGVRYREEVWTGIEYQVAGHMIWEGMIDEALAIVAAVDERYHPRVRNPYNEVECGDHYARALSCWGVFAAICGFEYDGPRGHIGFAPKLGRERFRAAFVAAEGWGTFEQITSNSDPAMTIEIRMRWGRLRVATLALESIVAESRNAHVSIDGKPLDASISARDERLRVQLQSPAEIIAPQVMKVRIS